MIHCTEKGFKDKELRTLKMRDKNRVQEVIFLQISQISQIEQWRFSDPSNLLWR